MEMKMLLILAFAVLASAQNINLPNFKWESYRLHKWQTVSPMLVPYSGRIPEPPTSWSFPDIPTVTYPMDFHPDLKHEGAMIPSGEGYFEPPHMTPVVYVDVERERYGGFGGTGDSGGYGAYKSKYGVKPDPYDHSGTFYTTIPRAVYSSPLFRSSHVLESGFVPLK